MCGGLRWTKSGGIGMGNIPTTKHSVNCPLTQHRGVGHRNRSRNSQGWQTIVRQKRRTSQKTPEKSMRPPIPLPSVNASCHYGSWGTGMADIAKRPRHAG